MKKTLIALLLACILTICCAHADDAVANPWLLTDEQSIADVVGVPFGVPEGAEDVIYFILVPDGLAEMQFVWNDMEYTARMKKASEFEDISGMYFDWGGDDPCLVKGCEGVTRRAYDEGETVDLCLWYDANAGIMYSISTSSLDLDGFDVLAAAEQVYSPAQAG